jgi:hypothetical protein
VTVTGSLSDRPGRGGESVTAAAVRQPQSQSVRTVPVGQHNPRARAAAGACRPVSFDFLLRMYAASADRAAGAGAARRPDAKMPRKRQKAAVTSADRTSSSMSKGSCAA